MVSSVNKAILIGNVGNDPEVRVTTSGLKNGYFNLATSESWIDKNTKSRREKTEWHRISIFSNGLCDIIEKYVKKGTKLYIEGAIQKRIWKDNEGNEKSVPEIVLQGFNCTLIVLDGKKNSQQINGNYKGNYKKANEKEDNNEDDDDIPF